MHHLHPGCLSHLLGQTLISENQPVSHKSFVPPRVLNSCWPNKSSISYLFRSTVVTLNTTPFSHRIMKSLWEKGQFPMLSPSLPACRTEQSINVGRAVPPHKHCNIFTETQTQYNWNCHICQVFTCHVLQLLKWCREQHFSSLWHWQCCSCPWQLNILLWAATPSDGTSPMSMLFFALYYSFFFLLQAMAN